MKIHLALGLPQASPRLLQKPTAGLRFAAGELDGGGNVSLASSLVENGLARGSRTNVRPRFSVLPQCPGTGSFAIRLFLESIQPIGRG